MKYFFSLMVFCLLSTAVHAGWIIWEVYRIPGTKSEYQSTLYYQNNMVKTEDEAGVTIIDLKTSEITFMDPLLKVFWKGTVEEYKKEITESAIRLLQKQLLDIPENRRESYQELYENMIRDMENPAVTFFPEVTARVEMTDEKASMIGYRVMKYLFYSDGFLREELWMSDQIRIGDEVDLEALNMLLAEMMMLGAGADYRISSEYIHLMKSGYPIRAKEFDGEGDMETEVIKIENVRIPDTEFLVPKGFNKVSLREILRE
jgi:hypothetical protein